jgi:hypothetical protein
MNIFIRTLILLFSLIFQRVVHNRIAKVIRWPKLCKTALRVLNNRKNGVHTHYAVF